MAKRPIFIPEINGVPVRKEIVEFKWHSGFALVQKQKNIIEIHEKAKRNNIYPVLEISTKSTNVLGKNLSAFNLKIQLKSGNFISVESAFQSSKVFENGGPFLDFANLSGKEIKKDKRLRNSGKLIYFLIDKEYWQLEPKTAFYDWLYINALLQNSHLSQKLTIYNGFTDIEFNPNKQINCQAHSAALFVSLVRRGIINEVMKSKNSFLKFLDSNEKHKKFIQGELFV